MLCGWGLYFSKNTGLSGGGIMNSVMSNSKWQSPASFRRTFDNDYVSFPVGYHNKALILPMKAVICFIKCQGVLVTDIVGAGILASLFGVDSVGYLEGMEVTFKDATNLYIWGGSIEINGLIYFIDAQLTFATGTLTANTLYYLYVYAPVQGSEITTEFSLSLTASTYDHTKAAKYMTGDGTKRWLADVKTA